MQSVGIVPITDPAVSDFAYVHGVPGRQIRQSRPDGRGRVRHARRRCAAGPGGAAAAGPGHRARACR